LKRLEDIEKAWSSTSALGPIPDIGNAE